MQAEFDNYIHNYRGNLDKALSISGESSDFFAQYKAKKLKEWLPEMANRDISMLDFGCGDGVMTNYVSLEFPHAHLYGVDPSPKSIHTAQELFSHIIFGVNSDTTTNLDFKDSTFDVIFAAGAFHHIPFELHHGYLSELKRILKPRGVLVLFELNPLNPLTVRTFKRNPIDQNAKMLWPWYAYRLTKNYGSSSLKFYCFFPRILSKLRFLERLLVKIPCGALYAVVIRKV